MPLYKTFPCWYPRGYLHVTVIGGHRSLSCPQHAQLSHAQQSKIKLRLRARLQGRNRERFVNHERLRGTWDAAVPRHSTTSCRSTVQACHGNRVVGGEAEVVDKENDAQSQQLSISSWICTEVPCLLLAVKGNYLWISTHREWSNAPRPRRYRHDFVLLAYWASTRPLRCCCEMTVFSSLDNS